MKSDPADYHHVICIWCEKMTPWNAKLKNDQYWSMSLSWPLNYRGLQLRFKIKLTLIGWWHWQFKMLRWYGGNTAVEAICSYSWSESRIWQVACCHTHTNLPQGERNVGVGLLARPTGSRTNSMVTKFLSETCLLLPHPKVPPQCNIPSTPQNEPDPFSNKTRPKLAKKCPMDNEKRTERVKDR